MKKVITPPANAMGITFKINVQFILNEYDEK